MSTTILPFLRALKENNNREWFVKNKPMYSVAKTEMESLVDRLIPEIAKFDPSVKWVTAKECLFRIFRDVRFSGDKSPYKINFGAWITKNGRKSCGPGYYIHLEPGASFLSAGVYMPGPDELKRIRQEIFYTAGELKTILGSPQLKQVCNGLDELDKLKRAPRDYPADFPELDLLKNRHYIVSHPLKDTMVEQDAFPAKILEVFRAMTPLNRYLSKAMEG